MKFLGLRLCDHDSNITYTNDDKVHYYKSERDFQIKHHGFNSLTDWVFVLKKWNVSPSEIDAICIVTDYFAHQHIKIDEKTLVEEMQVPEFVDLGFNCPIYRIDHHYAHALSCWTSGKEFDVDFVFDGFGNQEITHTIFESEERKSFYQMIDLSSVGELMGQFGFLYGLKGHPQDFAGKLMALKAYANLSEKDRTTKKEKYKDCTVFNFDLIWNKSHFKKFKKDQSKINYISISHEVSERVMTDYFKETARGTISYSGGVAQNTLINSAIKNSINCDIYIPPHCNDEGLSLGAVEFLRKLYKQELFDSSGFPFWQTDECPETRPSIETIKRTAEFLAEGKIVGWYQGHGEVGPRALGNRSILMNPTIKDGKDKLNERVKHREYYRPFGASILEEKTSLYFNWYDQSPYMLYVTDIIDKISFPSIMHLDETCRIQTVSKDLEDYYCLIDQFEQLTGIPMVLNTSLNNGGKPIAGHIDNSLQLFNETEMDVLVVGNQIYSK